MTQFGFKLFAERDGDALAVVDPHGERWTRGALLALVERLANALAAHGLAVGDTIAIAAPNCAEYLAAHLAGIAAGLYVVPINWHLADGEIAYLLDNSRAKVLITHSGLGASRVAALTALARGRALVVAVGAATPGCTALEEFIAGQPAAAPARPPGRMLAYTSATTGLPKGVWRALAGAPASLARFVDWHRCLGVEPEQSNVHLCASMLYHSAPLDGARVALEMGHTVVLLDGFEPERLLAAIERERVTTTFLVPTMFQRLLALPAETRARYSVATLRFVIHGGAPCPPEVKRRMLAWWGPVIWESYGAAEVQGTIASAAEWLTYPGTVGRPVPGSKLLIADDDGRELPAGATGTVYLTPYTHEPFAYLGDEAKTAAARRGEYVTVGDRGYVNEAGFLFLVGRDAELILCSGMNVYPAEIEQVLLAHPAVADCAVIGVPHALAGTVPEAHVELAAGTEPSLALTRELNEFLGAQLSPMKLPRRIAYTHALPRDPNGKLLRRRLLPTGAPP